MLHVLQQHPSEAHEASGRQRGRGLRVVAGRLHGAAAAAVLQLLRARVQGFDETLQFQLLPESLMAGSLLGTPSTVEKYTVSGNNMQ